MVTLDSVLYFYNIPDPDYDKGCVYHYATGHLFYAEAPVRLIMTLPICYAESSVCRQQLWYEVEKASFVNEICIPIEVIVNRIHFYRNPKTKRKEHSVTFSNRKFHFFHTDINTTQTTFDTIHLTYKEADNACRKNFMYTKSYDRFLTKIDQSIKMILELVDEVRPYTFQK